MSLLDLLFDIGSLPFARARAKSRSERARRVIAVAFWLIVLAAVALGLAAYFGAKP